MSDFSIENDSVKNEQNDPSLLPVEQKTNFITNLLRRLKPEPGSVINDFSTKMFFNKVMHKTSEFVENMMESISSRLSPKSSEPINGFKTEIINEKEKTSERTFDIEAQESNIIFPKVSTISKQKAPDTLINNSVKPTLEVVEMDVKDEEKLQQESAELGEASDKKDSKSQPTLTVSEINVNTETKEKSNDEPDR